MCTPSQKLPFDSRSIVMASSKSRACSPSIVTVATGRKSVRPRISRSLTDAADATRFLDEPPPNGASGMLNFRMMILVSTPGSSTFPSTSAPFQRGPGWRLASE
jgi:hypothetical protein